MSEIEVYDNFLPDDAAKSISDLLLSTDFPWFYHPFVAYSSAVEPKDYYFTHTFFSNHTINSDHFYMLSPLLERVSARALVRCKANLYPNVDKIIENDVHRDWPFPHRGFVYYINTNNGYTGFENGLRVESIANRILLFDSSTPHFSTSCTDEKVRVNINCNFF